ncbi:MAG: hypothetical protein EBE86_011080 [Hormoscilla sp. GUM202]|nr:hypothetical protein [Hormoscilla sp. GUM202]
MLVAGHMAAGFPGNDPSAMRCAIGMVWLFYVVFGMGKDVNASSRYFGTQRFDVVVNSYLRVRHPEVREQN